MCIRDSSCSELPVKWELELEPGAYDVTIGYSVVDISRGDPQASYTAGCMLEGVPVGTGDTVKKFVEGQWVASAQYGGTVADTPQGCQCEMPFIYAGGSYNECISLPGSGTVDLDGTQFAENEGPDIPVRFCATKHLSLIHI